MRWVEIRDQVNNAAREHGLDPALVRAVVEQESAYSPFASRFEPGYPWLINPITWQPQRVLSDGPPASWPDWIDTLRCTSWTELVHQRTSWGLMQIMGANAREAGLLTELTRLTEPEMGLHYGCKFLSRLVSRHGELGGLEAYNDGKADGMGGGVAYAKKVIRRKEGFACR